ncbi:MAG: Histone deacetylase superfamily [Verrucomicrobiales bacterium]|nr:Histone deacetylase superfamily [Verrucomicrobiales bacterium]
MKIITDERCIEYSSPGHPERPQRVARTLDKLRSQTTLPVTWAKPLPVDDSILLRAHTPAHLKNISSAADFDADTPAYPNIAEHARRSVGGALQALHAARSGEMGFSLMRPPGHHATRSQAMGFCYFNNIAVAALDARAQGFKRVAVYDFDVHHGNGTEDILLGQDGCLFVSIHQFPAYPGTGETARGENCLNFPVAPRTPREEYHNIFERAFVDVEKFKPDLIAVSAGFDAYAKDPLAQETLEDEDFQWLGERIRKFQVPSFSILEGGYSSALPDLVFAYLQGLQG